MAIQRGLDAKHEQNQQRIIRDTRPMGERVADFCKNPKNVAYLLISAALFACVLTYLADIALLFGASTVVYCLTRKSTLPFRLPKRAKTEDYNDLAPGSNKPRKSQGIYFFGNEKSTNHELWFSNEDMRTHVLIFGSTGSGKTEAMISLAYNTLLQSSGFIYVDGKGDNSLYAKIFSMVRSVGREDDLLLINFMTGARDIIGPQKNRLSNTMNPFSMGSSSMLSQLVVSLMDKSSNTPDGDMWKGRAIAFVEALMKVLVAMRDLGHLLLDANTVRNYFHLDRIEAMVLDNVFIRDGQESVSLETLPPTVMEPLRNYLLTLPGYSKEKKGKQVSQVLEQHGFITMQLVRVFTSLADTYGHILRTKLAEVDLKDVVLNRRILIVLLPALEKSPDELSNLGKVIIASLKTMMAAGLGDSVEGQYADLVESKPTNANTPFLCILDEYGYYAVQGFAVVPAQARSLGFSVVFAGQDLPAFQKASKEEAASIGANTNIKICMKLEDPIETWDFFMKTAGESYVTHVESYNVKAESALNNYQDTRGARLEKRARVDLLDLKEQRMGEAHIFFKSKIVRSVFFFANPKPVKKLRLNHFLKINGPSDADIRILKTSQKEFDKKLVTGFPSLTDLPVDEDLNGALQKMKEAAQTGNGGLVDVALTAFQLPMDVTLGFFDEADAYVEEYPEHQLQVFTPLRKSSYLEGLIITKDLAQFAAPMLSKIEVRDGVEYISRLCGKSSQESTNIAMELVGDLRRGTHYPPEVVHMPTVDKVVRTIDELLEAIVLKTAASKKDDE